MNTQPIPPKFALKQLVSFEGANHLRALKKTFIHAIATEDNINYYYAIEHPDGKLLHETTEHEFAGYDLKKMKYGLKYISANETELHAVENATPAKSEPPAPVEEKKYTLTFTEGQMEAISGAIATCQQLLPMQKGMILTQEGMTEETFEVLLKNTNSVAEVLKASGFEI